MPKTLTALLGMSIEAIDGQMGTVEDVLFDDRAWRLRYLVVDPGKWLTGRRVLISPLAVSAVAGRQRHFDVGLTRDQVRDSPDIDTNAAMSRQHERWYFDYYGYPYYWASPLPWGTVAFPPLVTAAKHRTASNVEPNLEAADEKRLVVDRHLRSAKVVTGYHIKAMDGPAGHVEDFFYDEQDWSIESLIVDTRNWLCRRHVIVAIDRVERVSWDDRTVEVDLSRDRIRQPPGLHSHSIITPVRERNHSERLAAFGRTEDGCESKC